MPPHDPATGPRYALRGRVVTMDAARHVHDSATIYVDGARIRAVVAGTPTPPPGFADVAPLETGGTIYPGLIELHNHLSYNALPLWQAARRYTNRDQWAGIAAYGKQISGPMRVLGSTAGFPEAVARYSECKCLLGGVTTSQGVALFSDPGITHLYRGVVRNVEESGGADLPAATAHIADVEAMDAAAFQHRLQQSTCLLLHLSEGTDAKARAHFEALHLSDGTWAIAPSLAGIHCVALTADDFGALHAGGGSMVWSPLSNLVLYGATADVAAARAQGVRIGIGADWSPSGSKNLLGELKVARLVSAQLGGVFTDADLVAMATCDAAAVLRWDGTVGTIEPGKRADLLVIDGVAGDAYAALVEARETAISLVIIDGVPRYGLPPLMAPFGPGTESWRVGGEERTLNLAQADADPAVEALTLRAAADRLADGLQHLPELARALEQPRHVARARPQWFLALDQPQPLDAVLRPYLGARRRRLAADRHRDVALAAQSLSTLLQPMSLDPLTVADDPTFVERLGQQPNLPDTIKQGLASLL